MLMKSLSWFSHHHAKPPFWHFLFRTPLLSPKSRGRYVPSTYFTIILKLILSVLFLFFVLNFAYHFLFPLDYAEILLISPMVYFLTEAVGALGQLLFMAGPKVSSIHNHPLRSKSLGDFWGRRWNLWVQDWLRDMSRVYRTNWKMKLLATFFISGLFHEVMFNLPYFLVYKKSYFGNMMLYFIIQGLGLWIEKRWILQMPNFVRRLYLWSVIILPAPIFINRPLLKFLGLDNG